ncbi:MAG TPA: accessory factor UbiK family protein [Thiolinea sp.]|nr:accessory factor UbiK family protein [Thiolinea sp.]
MANPLDEMMKKFSDLMPEPVRNMQEDLEKNIRGMLETGLQKMNLVTREEFDIQTAVLQRTREKLEALEARLNEWENKQAPATTQTQTHSSDAN